jgi:hypothetical protein
MPMIMYVCSAPGRQRCKSEKSRRAVLASSDVAWDEGRKQPNKTSSESGVGWWQWYKLMGERKRERRREMKAKKGA